MEMHGNPGVSIISSFGMHPQLPLVENAAFMEDLLRSKRIQAVGEAGFDMYSKEFKATIMQQEEAWSISVELSDRYRVPLVIHCRKALDRMFRDYKKLSRVSAVIFHSFQGSPDDARSLLRHGVNGFFSFGKPLIAGDKSAAACVGELDFDRLLMETDAPYQTLKGEKETQPGEIVRVYEAAYAIFIEKNRKVSLESFSEAITGNFKTAYGIL
jgi:Mg-dependent DNase